MDLDAHLAEEHQQGRLSGSVLVRRSGTTLLNRGYGYADREQQRPNTPETAFQLCSVSKQFTAAATLLLQERAALSVDDKISTRLPDCPETWEPITIHHLLTHTSGIGHWQDYPDVDLYTPASRADLLQAFESGPLQFAPGTGWSYSSPGYVLLAHIAEQVSGVPYTEFLRRNIFEPLGMERSGAGSAAPYLKLRAKGYEGESGPVPSFELDSVGIGAGDLWSTTEDLAIWNAALAVPGLLSAASLGSMFSQHVRTTRSFPGFGEISYGYGWIVTALGDRSVIYHTGDNSGFRCINVRIPNDDLSIIVLANDHQTDALAIGISLANALLGS